MTRRPPLNDGTFSGTSNVGHDGPVAVEVTAEGGVITAVEVTKENETESIGHAAVPTLCEEAVAAQGPDIEAVVGATTASKAFVEVLTGALAKAQA